jgi:hypothetical protein
MATTTTYDNRGVDDGDTTTATATAVVAPAATPPLPPLTATMAKPCGPSTSTPGLTPFRCGLVHEGVGGRRQAASPIVMLADALTNGLPPQ